MAAAFAARSGLAGALGHEADAGHAGGRVGLWGTIATFAAALATVTIRMVVIAMAVPMAALRARA
jgi:hypothetical protein